MENVEFKNKIKFSISNWESWKNDTKEDIMIGNFDSMPNIELVYIPNHINKTVDHIATYNKKEQTLYFDNVDLLNF